MCKKQEQANEYDSATGKMMAGKGKRKSRPTNRTLSGKLKKQFSCVLEDVGYRILIKRTIAALSKLNPQFLFLICDK